jgi:hypothetical protein
MAKAGDARQVDAGCRLPKRSRCCPSRLGRDPCQRHYESQNTDGDVDQEYGAPAPHIDEYTADREPRRRGDHNGNHEATEHPARRCIHAGPLGPAANEKHRGGVGARGPDTDQDPGHNQREKVVAQTSKYSTRQHRDDPHYKDPPWPELFG